MRSILEVLERTSHPVGIVTKSALVTRDIDLLAPMAAKGLAKVALSITTLDADLARTMEPRASTRPDGSRPFESCPRPASRLRDGRRPSSRP
jgi:DNA repair photolyase